MMGAAKRAGAAADPAEAEAYQYHLMSGLLRKPVRVQLVLLLFQKGSSRRDPWLSRGRMLPVDQAGRQH